MTTTIITLFKQGKTQRAIARDLKLSRKTVKRAVDSYNNNGKKTPTEFPKTSKLDPYEDTIIEFLEKDISIVRIHEELRSKGLDVGYTTVRDKVRAINFKHDVCVRFHTKPGEEVQIDFGYVGLQMDSQNKRKKAWAFNMRLSYSRLDYYEIVFDQTVKTFIEAHINAFKYFGGVPKVVKIDNLKAAILEANFYQDVHQKEYLEFAKHYGCWIVPCRVAKPQEKGKVEAGIKFIKNNFFAGRAFNTQSERDHALSQWMDKKSNRIHGTTKKVPRELFKNEEKDLLLPLPINDYQTPEIKIRKVSKDCHVTFVSNYYSVPYQYVGKKIEIHCDSKLIQIYHANEVIALHSICRERGQFITNEAHYPKYKNFTPQSEEYQRTYKEKMFSIGQYAGKVFSELLIRKPYHWYRMVKGILRLKKIYPDDIIEKSCKRATEFDAYEYNMIKSICESGSYNLPSENQYKMEEKRK